MADITPFPTDGGETTDAEEAGPDATHEKSRRVLPSLVIVIVLAAVFASILFAKTRVQPTAPTGAVSTSALGARPVTAGASLTSAHNDAVADYETALATGRPVYVLFHSLS